MSLLRVDEIANLAGTAPARQDNAFTTTAESVDISSGTNAYLLATTGFVKGLLGLAGASVLAANVKTLLSSATFLAFRQNLLFKGYTATATAGAYTMDLANGFNHRIVMDGSTLTISAANVSLLNGCVATLFVRAHTDATTTVQGSSIVLETTAITAGVGGVGGNIWTFAANPNAPTVLREIACKAVTTEV